MCNQKKQSTGNFGQENIIMIVVLRLTQEDRTAVEQKLLLLCGHSYSMLQNLLQRYHRISVAVDYQVCTHQNIKFYRMSNMPKGE